MADKPVFSTVNGAGIELVSVIIPVYNGAAQLPTLLAALCQQSYPTAAYEILVVDNRSTDQTAGVVTAWQNRTSHQIRLLHEGEVQGSYAARNRGVAAATGSILAFTDADCVPSPTWLAEGVAGLKTHRVAYGAGRVQFTFQQARPNLYAYYDAGTYLNQQKYIETRGYGATANLFARRQLFDQYGCFRAELPSGGDQEWGRRLYTCGERPVYLSTALVQHPARTSWRALQQKERRIISGQQIALRLGLTTFRPRAEARALWRRLRHPPTLHSVDWPQPPTAWQQRQLRLLHTFFAWQRWWYAWRTVAAMQDKRSGCL